MADARHKLLKPTFEGLYFDEFSQDSAWLRERATLHLPPLKGLRSLRLVGEGLVHPEARASQQKAPGLRVLGPGGKSARLEPGVRGVWILPIELSPGDAEAGIRLELALEGVSLGNALAWAGRVTGFGPWQHFRRQHRNRQLRIRRLETDTGEAICDFSLRGAPFRTDLVRRTLDIGMNIVGFLSADLGVGESARCMVRAADAAGIPTALVPLKLHCKNPMGDLSFADRFREDNPHGVNVVHIDPPASQDIDHHHGVAFRRGKHNIAYWAWELPDFPDAWVPACAYFDEIWCPSDFVREAISMKASLPVLTMPHAIHFERPQGNFRGQFGLPASDFIFLFAYDLNSYSERKNPGAVLQAFRSSGLAGRGASLAIKVHNAAGNPEDFARLKAAVADLPGTTLIADTLSRSDLYRLEAACDCFVSLHRSEGFGLAVAESMFLGKPVISTDWSATAEYVTEENGCPVRCMEIMLEKNIGPYTKGSHWAQPDPEHAAWWMKKLFEDRALAAQLGAAGRATIEERFSPAVIGERYRRRLEAIAMA